MGIDEHDVPATDGDGPKGDTLAERRSRLARAAVNLDSRPGLLAAARRLRRRLPGDDRFGDALSTAGVTPIQVVARGVWALRPEQRESVVQELGLAGLQVWQSLSEATGRGRGDQPLAVLFTDLVGFSSWALKAGDAAALQLLREVGTVEDAAITNHGGQIVKRLGDGLMATFFRAQGAVEAALQAQDGLQDVKVDGYSPRMRAGVHWGRPRKLGGDYLGVDVNVAARVGDAAKAGELLVSETVVEHLDMSAFSTSRPKRLKAEGAPRDMQVVRVSRA